MWKTINFPETCNHQVVSLAKSLHKLAVCSAPLKLAMLSFGASTHALLKKHMKTGWLRKKQKVLLLLFELTLST